MNRNKHTPVLLEESLEFLKIEPNDTIVDATFGGGGHTAAMLKAGATVIAFDWDKEAITQGVARFKPQIQQKKLYLVHESFSKLTEEVEKIAKNTHLSISAVLFDFGTSTEQLMSADRGFSFMGNGPLDMRMDTRLAVMAKDILAVVPEKQLEQLFRDLAGETQARRIAKAIKNAPQPITTTTQLVSCIQSVTHKKSGLLHPATKIFQALRLAVNGELSEIQLALPQALSLVKKGGRVVCIAFHEGEDRIVKQQFAQWDSCNRVKKLQKKAIKPSELELQKNPRARSARLRAVEKL
ncbi:MAG: 16S rRNA (cytosine(1402)-N(4))-methyltransferase RsmH [Candidatus Pacebacteria bacterium]|nr:16S rRNA (cytosine(1402)-N(4))-methyltransferase RsmH [Candidatus Paceibacterota bacterium]PIR60697.1 MAG: 16S rRNA (cytosine(1402)-N(4))-methyltransferase [Candidatus Pacebacteria bacterium CG10_big_fil_rev_8_21_14_0_10_44_54]